MDRQALHEFGLSGNEIKVYLSGLKVGLASVSSHAEEASLPRTTTYDLLKSLKEKGLASYVIKSGVKCFSVVDPKELLVKLQEKEKKLKDILPELENLQKITLKTPKVEFYQGVEGFKTVANDLISKPNTNLYCFVSEKTLQFMPIFHMQFRRKRKERKITVKVITERTPLTIKMKKDDKKELRETRFSPKVMKDSLTSFFIYDNKIIYIIAVEKEQFGIIIENNEIANFQKKIFEHMWAQARK